MPKSWTSFNLTSKIGAFVEGGANFLNVLGIPLKLGIGIIAVLVACFAATTLDSATRLQRYVIQELGGTLKIKPLNMNIARIGSCNAAELRAQQNMELHSWICTSLTDMKTVTYMEL